jgi:hypothetical protein
MAGSRRNLPTDRSSRMRMPATESAASPTNSPLDVAVKPPRIASGMVTVTISAANGHPTGRRRVRSSPVAAERGSASGGSSVSVSATA